MQMLAERACSRQRVSIGVGKTRVRRQSRSGAFSQSIIFSGVTLAGACWLASIWRRNKGRSALLSAKVEEEDAAMGRPSVGMFSFFLALRGTAVTAGTGRRACPSPVVSVPRHGQVSVKDPSAAPWTPPPPAGTVAPLACTFGRFWVVLEENSRKCFPTLFLWCLPVRVTVNGCGGEVVNPLLSAETLQAAPP